MVFTGGGIVWSFGDFSVISLLLVKQSPPFSRSLGKRDPWKTHKGLAGWRQIWYHCKPSPLVLSEWICNPDWSRGMWRGDYIRGGK